MPRDDPEHWFAASVMPRTWQRYTTIGLMLLGIGLFPTLWAIGVFPKYIVGFFVMIFGYGIISSLAIQWVFVGRKVAICITTDGLTVSRRPGDIFAFRDAELGQWEKIGSRVGPVRVGPYGGRALFLTSGPHRFVLGEIAADPVINPNDVPIEGPQVKHQDLDAWTTSSVFDELLAIVLRRKAQA